MPTALLRLWGSADEWNCNFPYLPLWSSAILLPKPQPGFFENVSSEKGHIMRPSCSLLQAPERKDYWPYGKLAGSRRRRISWIETQQHTSRTQTDGPFFQHKSDRSSVCTRGHAQERGAGSRLAVKHRCRLENRRDYNFESTGIGSQLKCWTSHFSTWENTPEAGTGKIPTPEDGLERGMERRQEDNGWGSGEREEGELIWHTMQAFLKQFKYLSP